MMLDQGLVYMSDTRTNSGVDNISTFSKMHIWNVPGERCITLLSAGNLATTQAVVSQLDERSLAPADRRPSILEAPTMFQVAKIVGKLLGETIRGSASENGLTGEDRMFNATMILGGQIAGMEPRLFLIYPEGNFIEASADTPFFQIGETKYGRPILVRGYSKDMSFEAAVKLMMVSFDSTIKANLSVGLPIDMMVQREGAFEPAHKQRFSGDDDYYESISKGWGEALRTAFYSLPPFEFEKTDAPEQTGEIEAATKSDMAVVAAPEGDGGPEHKQAAPSS